MTMNFYLRQATAVTLVASFFITSCAASSDIQPRVNSLVVAQKLDNAIETLGVNPKAYGKNNQLLYWLDRGMVYHSAGRYKESIDAFAKAQQKFDELYTKSITKLASAWALNDYWAPYRGEDYEYVLVNIFQALNYTMLGDTNEALVEARDVDSKLNLINGLYAGKNIYKEDAFARFLMGVLYEATGSSSDLNDAYISYARAYEGYLNDFSKNYSIEVPELLKENLLTLAHLIAPEELARYRSLMPEVPFITLEEKNKKAEVYLIEYTGFSPIKVSWAIPIPLDTTHVTQLTFPKFNPRYSEIKTVDFFAVDKNGKSSFNPAQIGHNIETLAPKNLEHRRVQIFAKSILRPAVKYAAERVVESQIEEKYGENTAGAFNVLANLYNLSSERADLRSWQTLPAQIRVARLLLDAGEYEFFVQTYADAAQPLNQVSLGKLNVSAGQKKFFVFRNYR